MKINLERIYKNKEELLKDISELERNIPRKTRGNLGKSKKKEIKRLLEKLIDILWYVRIYKVVNEENKELDLSEYVELEKKLLNIYYEKFYKAKKRKKDYISIIEINKEIDKHAQDLYDNYNSMDIDQIREEYKKILNLFIKRDSKYNKYMDEYAINVLEKVYLNKREKIDEFNKKYDKYLDKENEESKNKEIDYLKKEEALKIIDNTFNVFGEKYKKIVKKVIEEEKVEMSKDTKRKMKYGEYIFVTNTSRESKFITAKTLLHELGHYIQDKFDSKRKIDRYIAEVVSTLNEYMILKYVIDNNDIEDRKEIICRMLLEKYSNIFPNILRVKIENIIPSQKFKDPEVLAYEVKKEIEKFKNKKIEEKNKYKWITLSRLLNVTNSGVYSISRILSLNIYMHLEQKYKKGEKWSDIYKILKFRKIDEVIEYLGYSAKTDEDKEEAIEKMYEKAIIYLEKKMEEYNVEI